MRTTQSVSMNKGRVEVVAKMPSGNWLWPSIKLLPKYNEYGEWPRSGGITLMETRGNHESYSVGGINTFSSSLHWGINQTSNKWNLTHALHNHSESLADDFHTYGLYWDADKLYVYFDNPDYIVFEEFFNESFWEKGEFSPEMENPWVNEDNSAPFNREFYLQISLSVGGTNGYFPDGLDGKPWSDSD